MSDYKFSFEILSVWQDAKNLAKKIYIDTSKFPTTEKYGIINQMQRAVISVSSNIAEGSSRKSYKDQARFYQIAYSSLMELMSQIIICEDLSYMEKEVVEKYKDEIKPLSYGINALYNSCIRKTKEK